jgi:hypothetical protein
MTANIIQTAKQTVNDRVLAASKEIDLPDITMTLLPEPGFVTCWSSKHGDPLPKNLHGSSRYFLDTPQFFKIIFISE